MNKKIHFARSLRRNQTDAERKLWHFLRDRQLVDCKFRRQYPVGPFIVDFYCFDKQLAIELDGGQHALQVTKDKNRTKYLEGRGFRLLRFWDNDVLKNPEAVLETILNFLSTPHPNLSTRPNIHRVGMG